jgi:hypothetical protein
MSEELEQMKRELAALKDRVDPPPMGPRPAPRDYTAGFSAPSEVIGAMARVVDPRALVGDFRRGVAAPSSLTSSPAMPAAQRPRGSNGWVPETPLPSTPPGSRYIDALVDDADRRDRAERGC